MGTNPQTKGGEMERRNGNERKRINEKAKKRNKDSL